MNLQSQHLAPWEVSHIRVQTAAVRECENDLEISRSLRVAAADEVHVRLGMASFAEYVAATFGVSKRTAHERIRVANALEYLPKTEAALEAGSLKFSFVREITRIATASTEEAWIELAHGQSVRDVEAMVSGRRIGDHPTDPRRPEDQVHKLRIDARSETYAMWQQASAKLQRDAGHALTQDELLHEMARNVLGGPTEEGRASYQVELDVCEGCSRGMQLAGGEAIEVPAEIVEMAVCDAQTVTNKRASQSVPPATKRAVRRRQKNRCALPGCSNHLFLDIHHVTARADGGTNDENNLLLLCGTHHRAYHRGYLVIHGIHAHSLSFSHADGTAYGHTVNASPGLSQLFQDVHDALRKLGFSQTETREAVAYTSAHVGTDPKWDQAIEIGLRWLSNQSANV